MSRKTWLILAWVEVACTVINVVCAALIWGDAWAWVDLGFAAVFAAPAWAYFHQAAVTR